MTLTQATSEHELLTALADVPCDQRASALNAARRPLRMMRAAVDLCGEDSTDLTFRACVTALVEGF